MFDPRRIMCEAFVQLFGFYDRMMSDKQKEIMELCKIINDPNSTSEKREASMKVLQEMLFQNTNWWEIK